MFVEYNMMTAERFSEYFGFTNSEVDRLFSIYQKRTQTPRISREDVADWYDGYCTAAGNRIYNPRSIVCAFTDNQLRSYWTSSSPYDEIFYYIRNNVEAVRDDLILLIAGEGIKAGIQDYAAVSKNLKKRGRIVLCRTYYC